jgi:cytochrome c
MGETMRKSIAMLAAALGLGLVAGARAQQPAPTAAAATLSGEELYKQRTCVACHGPDAKTPILPVYPKLAGQNPAYMLQQAMDIKSGARSNGNTAAMKGVMHLVSDEELKVVTDWLGTLKWQEEKAKP